MADDAVVPWMFREHGREEKASAEFKCSKNGRGVYYPTRDYQTRDVFRTFGEYCTVRTTGLRFRKAV